MKYIIYNLKNEEMGSIVLSDDVFKIKENNSLIHQVVVSQFANARISIAHTKGRGEVSGGGVKPWRQKGTGRARHGSIRSPIWIGGGVTFGPKKNRNFSCIIPNKMRKKSLKMIFSSKAQNGLLKIVDDLKIKEPKTKKMDEIFHQLFKKDKQKINKNSNFVLVLLNAKNSRNVALANKNIPYSKTLNINNLNVIDLISYKHILVDQKGMEIIKDKF